MKTENKKIKRLLKKALSPLSFINKCFVKKKQILLYSNLGFRDNIKSLFDYLIRNGYNKQYKIIVSLNENGSSFYTNETNVVFVGNKRGLITYLTSKYVFYCFGSIPIKPTKKQVVVNMWHGMPLKKIGLLDENNINNKYFFFTNVLATSTFFAPLMSKAFGCPQKNVLICGQPRNDELFTDRDIKKIFSFNSFYKVAIWMPTFRTSKKLNENNATSNSGLPFVNNIDDLKKINNSLAIYNILLVIKMHPMQDSLPFDKKDLSHLIFIDDDYIFSKRVTLYEFISCFDFLVTDYSSVYFDYLLLNRPICFTIDDVDDYSCSRGFVFEKPIDYMPGYKAFDLDTFLHFFECAYQGVDDYSSSRSEAITLFHSYPDGYNTKRLLENCGIVKE